MPVRTVVRVVTVFGFIGLGVVVVVLGGGAFVKAFPLRKDTPVHTPSAAAIILTPPLPYR